MTWPITILFSAAAFVLGWWSGKRRLESKISKLSGDLKKSSDPLADGVKRNQS